MATVLRAGWALLVLGFLASAGSGQQPATPSSGEASLPGGTAATVNGQPVPEVAVQRGLRRLPAEKQAQARSEILNFLIDTALVDQYLAQARVEVDAREVDTRLQEVKDEISKGGQPLAKVLEELLLTEDELRTQLAAELRWEKFCNNQVADKDLRDLFDKNPEMFDGSMVRARHILLTPPAGDSQAAERAHAQLAAIRQQVEEQVARELAKLTVDADSSIREKARARLTETAFAEAATKDSVCPSKAQGGDLGWFPRAGSMVEPFARAAFALQPYQMSDVVATQFGQHLILVTDRRPGKPTKFEDIKDVVKEIYCERLREALCSQLRPKATIVLAGQAKP